MFLSVDGQSEVICIKSKLLFDVNGSIDDLASYETDLVLMSFNIDLSTRESWNFRSGCPHALIPIRLVRY